MKANKNYLIILYSIILLIISCKNELGKNELGKDGLIGASFDSEEIRITFIDTVKVEIAYISNESKSVGNYSYDKINSDGRISGKKPDNSSYDIKFNLIKSETDINKTKIIFYGQEFFFNGKISKGKFIINNKSDGFKFSSLKKYIPFLKDPCNDLEGTYVGRVVSNFEVYTLIYTLKEDKTESYDGRVIVEHPDRTNSRYPNRPYNGYYRKIGEEIEIELSEEDGKVFEKFRIERNLDNCIKELQIGSLIFIKSIKN